MATLIHQWNEIERLISEKEETFLATYFFDKQKPTEIFKLVSYSTIVRQEITGVYLAKINDWKPSFDKKPTRKKLQELIDWNKRFEPSEDKIYLRYQYTTGQWKASGAHLLIKIKDDKTLAFAESDLYPLQREWKEKFEPRDGHIACTYCRKQVPAKDAVDFTVIARQYPNMRKTSKYCSKECGGYDQMAHEG